MLDVTDITFGAAKRLAVLKKRFGEIMMLIIILVKGVNIRKLETSKETQTRKST